MIARDSLSGVVLSGGQARRMQRAGRESVEKGLLVLHGRPLVAWSQQYLAARVDTIYVSANRCIEVYARYGQVVADDPSLGTDVGPLAGLASVLARVQTSWVLSLPVDVPVLPVDLLERLAAQAEAADSPIAYAFSAQAHPLCMLVHRSTLASLRDYLLRGERKVQIWQALNRAVQVDFPVDEISFLNINGPADLVRAEQCIAPDGVV